MEETLETLGLSGFVNTTRLSLQGGTGACPEQPCRVRQDLGLHPVSPETLVPLPVCLFSAALECPTLGQLSSPGSPAAQGLSELPGMKVGWGGSILYQPRGSPL